MTAQSRVSYDPLVLLLRFQIDMRSIVHICKFCGYLLFISNHNFPLASIISMPCREVCVIVHGCCCINLSPSMEVLGNKTLTIKRPGNIDEH